jgi:hypothetical protein
MKRLNGNCYLEVTEGIKVYHWDFQTSIKSGYECEPFIETFDSEFLAVERERRFPKDLDTNNPPIYVNTNLPEYGFAVAEKLPEEKDDLVIDLGW